MKILGIDTSCDDTSAAVVVEGRKILSNIVHSQVKLHHPHGGVVPELASREHLRNIMPVVQEALAKADAGMGDIDGVAVTVGPGLVGSLLVGLYYAKAMSYVNGLPMAAVNHLEGHILSIFLEDDVPDFPFICMTVSGGHTSIYNVRGYGDYIQMGQTLDDAAGEAFDKVAKILGLGYPGGAVIEKLARQGKVDKIKFPRAFLSKDSLDFSFSGLKTSVSLFIKKWKDRGTDRDVSLADIAASFQEAVIDVLVAKVLKAADMKKAGSVVVAGGVACNSRLRERLRQDGSMKGIKVYHPRPSYCTDNGAMIAVAGYRRLLEGNSAEMSVDVRSKYPIEDIDRAAR